jgi:uncharacterized protein
MSAHAGCTAGPLVEAAALVAPRLPMSCHQRLAARDLRSSEGLVPAVEMSEVGRMKAARTFEDIRSDLRELLPALKKQYGVRELAVFGSWARGEQRQDSDIDLLVDFDRPIGFEIVALKDEIEAHLGLEVDLVMRGSLRRRIGKRIQDEARLV